ncbi:hypothetical protein [Rhodococcus sp. (in: high G+C Gram-positive bacteria)]|uniref:hypothetical protein n=1 Tax=Rhodococcus sp. TaxID=1831 RepID=UPI003B8A8CE9
MEQTASTSHNGHRSGNGAMSFADGAVRTVSGIAGVTTSSIGAVGGAAVGGLVGGVRGAISGAAGGTRQGLARGSHSTPAAVLTMAAAGAVGLVEWPVVLTVGGAALVLRQLHERGAPPGGSPAPSAQDPGPASKSGAATTTPAAPPPVTTPPASKVAANKSPAGEPAAHKGGTAKSTVSRPQGRATR